MPKNTSTSISRTVGVVLFDRFSNHCLANAIEPLRACNTLLGRDAYHWDYLTLDGRDVTSSSGLPVTPSGALGQSGKGDVLFLLPSYDFQQFARQASRPLQAAARRYRVLAGMDAGSWLLAQAGLLTGRRATIHWEEMDLFAETFPEVIVERRRVVRDGNLWSCAGAMSAFDLALAMIRNDFGPLTALEVAAFLMHGSAGADAEQAGYAQRIGDPLVTAAVSAMRDQIEDPMPLAALANRLGVSLRKLKAAFARELGEPPGQVYRRMRLNAARRFVEQTNLSVAEVAIRCGYEDAAAMTRAFKHAFGTTPRAVRQAGNP